MSSVFVRIEVQVIYTLQVRKSKIVMIFFPVGYSPKKLDVNQSEGNTTTGHRNVLYAIHLKPQLRSTYLPSNVYNTKYGRKLQFYTTACSMHSVFLYRFLVDETHTTRAMLFAEISCQQKRL